MTSDSLSLFNGQRLSIKTIERKAKLFERLLDKHGLDGVRVDNTNSTSGIQFVGPRIWIVTKKIKDGHTNHKWQQRWSVRSSIDEIPEGLTPTRIWSNEVPLRACSKFYQSLIHNGALERCRGIVDTSASKLISQDDKIRVHCLALEWFLGLASHGYRIDLVDDLDSQLFYDPTIKTLMEPWTTEESLQICLDLEGRSRPADD